MLEKSAFMFHHNFYPKPKIDLEDAKISEETWHKVQILKKDYDDIVSKHSIDIRLTHLEEKTIETDWKLHPIVSKPYPLPLKHHKFVKEEIENLLEARLIERSMSHYAAPIISSQKEYTQCTFIWDQMIGERLLGIEQANS